MPSPKHVAVPLLACLQARKLAVAIGHRPRELGTGMAREDYSVSRFLFSASPFILTKRNDGIYLLWGRPGRVEFRRRHR
jgi:hypothetical protein